MKHGPHRWEVINELVVCFTTSGAIRDDVWNGFVKDMSLKQVTKCLSLAVGDIDVTSVQRKAVSDVAKARAIGTAVVTDAKLVRGMVTAVSWLGVDIKAFPWTGVKEALKHLKVTPATERLALETVHRFRRDAGLT